VDVLTAYGKSNALLDVVARELGMTPETLKTHLRRIRAKYVAGGRAAPTRRDLYVRAIEDGFLPPPGRRNAGEGDARQLAGAERPTNSTATS
jgi:hypothetical protein